MPVITVKYDNQKVQNVEIQDLSEAIQQIVSKTTGIEDVFVYADSPTIQVRTATIEVFVQLTASKIADVDELLGQMKDDLKAWKQRSNFPHPVNLTLFPVPWKFELNI